MLKWHTISTKIHAATDALGNPVKAMADVTYDSDKLREQIALGQRLVLNRDVIGESPRVTRSLLIWLL